jgi:hypothetical protein
MLGRAFSTFCDSCSLYKWPSLGMGFPSVLSKTKTKEGHGRHVSCLICCQVNGILANGIMSCL